MSALFMAAGCGPDTSANDEAVALSVDKTTIEFTAEGGEQIFVVTASEGFYFPSFDADWLTLEKGGKDAHNKTVVTVKVQENTIPLRRQVRINVSDGKEKAYVDVVQAASDEGLTDGPKVAKFLDR